MGKPIPAVPALVDIHRCLPYPGTSVVVDCHTEELVQAGLVAARTYLVVVGSPAQLRDVGLHQGTGLGAACVNGQTVEDAVAVEEVEQNRVQQPKLARLPWLSSQKLLLHEGLCQLRNQTCLTWLMQMRCLIFEVCAVCSPLRGSRLAW